MNEETSQLIQAWLSRASGERDPFVKFFIMYMCLDAWTTSESSLDDDGARLRWLVDSDNTLKECWPELAEKEQYLNELAEIGRVEDMRPMQRGRYKYLRDPNDFGQVVRFIHQIRCNLFHGGKSPNNPHDVDLVVLGGDLLHVWLTYAVSFSSR